MCQHTTLPRDERPRPECGADFGPLQRPEPLTLSVDASGDHIVVAVAGELDLETNRPLQYALSEALDRCAGVVELDLAGVGFCDCSALNVLLRARLRAQRTSKRLVLRATSPAVERLLGLTGTLPLFTGSDGETKPVPPQPMPAPAA